jgi:TfoX/Sxy family transcriptional regulator of competence genes
MAYDERLSERVRELLSKEDGRSEVEMFGGLAFLLDGNMAVAVSSRGGLMVRVGTDAADEALAHPHARIVEMGSRQMKGWVLVEPAGLDTEEELEAWVQLGLTRARSLPPKS